MLIQGQVGQSAIKSMTPGTTPNIRQGQLGDVIVSQLHGRYYETAYRGASFSLSVSTAAAITGYTGAAGGTPLIAVYNPPNSGVNLVPIQAAYNNVVAASGAGTVSWALWYGQTAAITQSTLTVPTNTASLNRAGSFAIGYTNVALTSSTALTNNLPIGYYYWASAAGAFQSGPTIVDVNGLFVVPPGAMMALGGSAALTSATWTASLFWEELPI